MERRDRKVGSELSKDKMNRLKEVTKDCFHPYFKDRVKDLYHKYSSIADKYFVFNEEETFSNKIRNTRNYFTHWSEDTKGVDVIRGELVFLTRDLQLLLQLCIMTRLGFKKDDIEKIYFIDKFQKQRRIVRKKHSGQRK